jgi:hypothetical protein
MALFSADGWLFLLRWFHFLSGITWIGILYYFNFVQTPFFATAEAPVRAGMIVGSLVGRALWWFRWGAMFTFLTGWLACSLQGSVQRASFATTPKYIKKNEGVEKDVTTNPFDWALSFWKLHTITGAIVARILVDRSGIQSEGLSPVTNTDFDGQFRQANGIIMKLPSQKEIETKKADAKELDLYDQELSDIFLRLTDAWLMGNLSPEQRARLAALHYLDYLKRYELGWYQSVPSEYSSEMTNQDFKENADDWLNEELKWGSNLREMISV